MIVVGLLLVALALAVAVLVYLGTVGLTSPVILESAGVSVSLTPLALAAIGAGVVVALWLGWTILRVGARRSSRRRRDARESARVAKEQQAALQKQSADRRAMGAGVVGDDNVPTPPQA